MDKNTLSNYGWIVIAVLVLAVMIALATPFGKYIESGVKSTTEGLFSTSENAMNTAFGDMGVQVEKPTFEDGYKTPNGGTTETPDVPSGPAFGDNKIEYGKNDPDLNHNGVIPEGGTYYTDIVACDRCYQIPNSVEDTSDGGIKKTCDCGNTSFNPTILNEGESFPDTVSPYDIYIYNGYEYRFNPYYFFLSKIFLNSID